MFQSIYVVSEGNETISVHSSLAKAKRFIQEYWPESSGVFYDPNKIVIYRTKPEKLTFTLYVAIDAGNFIGAFRSERDAYAALGIDIDEPVTFPQGWQPPEFDPEDQDYFTVRRHKIDSHRYQLPNYPEALPSDFSFRLIHHSQKRGKKS